MTVYLDHAASTPMRPASVEAMLPFLGGHTGNPSGAHAAARRSRKAIDEARDVVADCLGARPGEIVFTGSGTEADNLAITGLLARRGGTAVCTAIEHHAVLDPVEHAGGRIVAVDADGVVSPEALAGAVDGDTSIVSVMLANNEVGSVQPLSDVDAAVHTDAVQAVTWLDVASLAARADLISVSAHKFGGPQGVGALVVRDGVELEPLVLGGGQERGLRSGTHNTAGIVGLAAALREAVDTRDETVRRLGELRDRLADGLLSRVPGCTETGSRDRKVAGICHLCFEDVDAESLLMLLDQAGLYASAGSSCSSGAMEPSHVLVAMGVPKELAGGSVRLSLGWSSTGADVDAALELIPPAVEQLRR